MLKVHAGEPLIDLIEIAYQANQPVLLEGPHGVGKSAIFAICAQALGIGCLTRDLSLMEPPDLVGIPRVRDDGRTHYASPSFLPDSGRGLMVFEELNRCPRYLQAPTLQLLTARRLNDYVLPNGWLPCAAINTATDGHQYQVDDLDAALLSRFLRVRVVADVGQWAEWARNGGNIHDKIVQFVEHSPRVFDDANANPRAWAYASNLLNTWEAGKRQIDMLTTCLAGVLEDKWALAFVQFYQGSQRPLTAEQVIQDYAAYRASMRQWTTAAQLDLVTASLEALKRRLQRQQNYETVIADPPKKENVESFISDLPADLRRELGKWLKDRGYDGLTTDLKST